MNTILTLMVFLTGILVGSIVTFFVVKIQQKNNQENLQNAYLDVYEKMQLQFENNSKCKTSENLSYKCL